VGGGVVEECKREYFSLNFEILVRFYYYHDTWLFRNSKNYVKEGFGNWYLSP
jgi:hypothetical protein